MTIKTAIFIALTLTITSCSELLERVSGKYYKMYSDNTASKENYFIFNEDGTFEQSANTLILGVWKLKGRYEVDYKAKKIYLFNDLSNTDTLSLLNGNIVYGNEVFKKVSVVDNPSPNNPNTTTSTNSTNSTANTTSENNTTASQEQLDNASTNSNTSIEDENIKYNWAGTYSGGDDNVGYTLKVDFPGPMRWTEFGWEMNVSGIQTYYIIKGYGIRDKEGNLELHYMEQVDGAFYQSENMDMNETMFKLKKQGNQFVTIDGRWKASDFIQQLKKD